MIEDKELIVRIRNGDEQAFERLVLKHREKALMFARRHVKDWHAAEDIVQDCFAYLFVNIENYSDKYSFKTYLFTIIRNKSIDLIRKQSRLTYSDQIELSDTLTPEGQAIQNEDTEFVQDCIRKLSLDYQTIINLIDIEGFSYKESARIMDKSVVQIKVLIYRARKKLKALIEKIEDQQVNPEGV